ncbi:MAG: hypothetical protein ABSG46_10960 [Candidatus Binataceae bacterium]|jgi:hypothetical protein
MRLRSILASASAAALLGSATAGYSMSFNVAVVCSTDDAIGSAVCAQVKQDIQNSRGYDLVDPQANVLQINIVSVDIDEDSSAISAVFLVTTPNDQPDKYIDQAVLVSGGQKVDQIANRHVDYLNKDIDDITNAMR